MNGANLSLPEPIELVALDPARNIRRRYSITASLDRLCCKNREA
ncbi:hypothetical protein [Altericroceibacterium spongiae]|nr:hypothetical protein [Altericroceibacterium spongiae]